MGRFEGVWLSVLSLASLATFACGPSGREETPTGDAAPAAAAEQARSGSYEVEGLTVQALTGRHRQISGQLRLEVKGERYEVDFDLRTMAPDFEEEVPVRIRGTGRGLIIGKVFTGTTEEWMALVPPPGGLEKVELRDAKLPGKAGRKIVSTSQASFDETGAFHIVLQNYPGPDERYEPSMTVLEGRRTDALRQAGASPPAED